MKIVVDVMSGDKAPLELIRGAAMAADEYDAEIVIVGDEAVISKASAEEGISLDKLTVIPSSTVINMEDKALSVVREKNDSSMAIGLRMLSQNEGDAFVSAGNTGALIAGSTLIVRRIKGIQRAAIGTLLPYPTPVLLMDSGANLEVTSDNIEQFARMGSIYMSKIFGIESPRVGQLNNGSEYTKGLPLQVKCYECLRESDINFVGNIEGNNIPFGACDVLVTDGFTGNIVLKYTEGMGKFMFSALKGVFGANIISKMAALMVKNRIRAMKKQFDSSEYGGAPIFGISKPVIKAHGSSDAKAIKNSIRQAISFINTGVISDIADMAVNFQSKSKAEGKK